MEISEPDNEQRLENYAIINVLSEVKEEDQTQVEGGSARQKDALFEKSGLNTQQVKFNVKIFKWCKRITCSITILLSPIPFKRTIQN